MTIVEFARAQEEIRQIEDGEVPLPSYRDTGSDAGEDNDDGDAVWKAPLGLQIFFSRRFWGGCSRRCTEIDAFPIVSTILRR